MKTAPARAPFAIQKSNSGVRGTGVEAHRGDAVEFGLLARILLGLFARVVALVEHLDLLELLEGLAQHGLGVVELGFQLTGRSLEVLAPADRGLGVGRIGEMGGIVNTGAFLLGLDLAVELGCDTIELGNDGLDLSNLAPLLVDLKFLQADEGFA